MTQKKFMLNIDIFEQRVLKSFIKDFFTEYFKIMMCNF